jgi:glyoxylase-like metal-dependent hydrolase (beta-lactamase superfamily II)
MYTPGHALDHVCFLESRYQAALVGDMLSTVSTIVIDPPEGHMRTYLDSLQRLLARPVKTVFPAHGPAHQNGRDQIRKLLEHRHLREQKIVQALEHGSRDLEQLLPEVYADTVPAAHPVAARSLLAGLIKLEEDGVCVRSGAGWSLTTH